MAINIDVHLVTDWREEYRQILASWYNQSFELWNTRLTKQELQSIWAQMEGSTSNVKIINLLGVPIGIRQPWANPGTSTNAVNIKNLPDADKYLQINSYELVNPAIVTSAITPYVMYCIDANNYFAVPEYASASLHMVRNGTYYGGMSQLGCYGLRQQYKEAADTMTARLGIMGKTADDIIFCLLVGPNKNNSGLSFCTAEFSSMFLEMYNGAPPAADPFSPGGTTHPGGGEGDWRIINDPIDFPDLPTISVADAGFISIWTPELGELRRLASFMWCADPLKIDFWKQMIANPLDLILGLQLLPFDIPAEGVGRVTLGLIDSKIDMHYTDTQFHEIDCGELELAEYWGAFLDYGPFTSLDIYLPYIGVRSLNINDCMPKTIHVKYYVDIVTGTCVAMVKCDDSIFYHFNGSCASQVPVTSGQAQQLFGQALGAAMKIAAGAATGGIAGALASTVGVASAAAQSGGAAGADRSGTISGTAGFMDTQVPYLIITRPRQAVPEEQNTLTGYPSYITAQLSELEGYTEVQVTHLHGMSCTEAELAEITQLLQEGVIF